MIAITSMDRAKLRFTSLNLKKLLFNDHRPSSHSPLSITTSIVIVVNVHLCTGKYTFIDDGG